MSISSTFAFKAPSVANAPAVLPQVVVDEKTLAFQALLRQTGYRSLSQIRIQVRDGLVILRGFVPSYYLKQVAQEAIRPMAIGIRIRNELRVR